MQKRQKSVVDYFPLKAKLWKGDELTVGHDKSQMTIWPSLNFDLISPQCEQQNQEEVAALPSYQWILKLQQSAI